MNKLLCAYCGRPYDGGWHDCDQAQASRRMIDDIIEGIHRQIKQPNGDPETSAQVRARSDRRRSMAAGLRSLGRPVKPDYEPLIRSEPYED